MRCRCCCCYSFLFFYNIYIERKSLSFHRCCRHFEVFESSCRDVNIYLYSKRNNLSKNFRFSLLWNSINNTMGNKSGSYESLLDETKDLLMQRTGKSFVFFRTVTKCWWSFFFLTLNRIPLSSRYDSHSSPQLVLEFRMDVFFLSRQNPKVLYSLLNVKMF